jgi:hypothetical protein
MTTDQERMIRIMDSDKSWWPLLSLRPKKHEMIPTKLVFLLATMFAAGVVCGALFMRSILGTVIFTPVIAIAGIIVWPASYFVLQATFVRAWNSRARELKQPE